MLTCLSCLYFHSLERGQRHLSSALCSLPLPLRNYGLSFAANFLLLLCLGPSFNHYKTMFPCFSPEPILHASTPGSLRPPRPLRLYFYRRRTKTCSFCFDSGKIPLSPHFAYELGCTHFLQVQPLHGTGGLPLLRALVHQQPCSNLPDTVAELP